MVKSLKTKGSSRNRYKGNSGKYTAENIERDFKVATTRRQREASLPNSRYANDAGYWEGGRCNWGGSHNLKEDCQVLASFFNKINELNNAKVELLNASEKQEFDSTKQKLSQQIQETINGLQAGTGYGTSIGGVCIIWDDFAKFIEDRLKVFRQSLEKLQKEVQEAKLDEAKKLRALKSEQTKLEKNLKELQESYEQETDPTKKGEILILIEEEKRKIKKNYAKQQEIKLEALGRDFDPDEHILEILDSVRKKLKKNRKSSKDDSDSSDDQDFSSDDENDEEDDSGDNDHKNKKKKSKKRANFFQKNQRLIIFAAIGLIVVLYLYSQKNDDGK